MSTVQEVEAAALKLDERARARIATVLLDSLPPSVLTEDEIAAEAARRDDELSRGAVTPMSHEEYRAGLVHRREK